MSPIVVGAATADEYVTVDLKVNGVSVWAVTRIVDAQFVCQVNGNAGTCQFAVRDLAHTKLFQTGQTIELTIDGILEWSGYVTKIGHSYAFDVDITTSPTTTERWYVIEGEDINKLLSKRVVWNKPHPTNIELTPPRAWQDPKHPLEWKVNTPVDVVVKWVLSRYSDLPADGVNFNGVQNFGSPNPDSRGAYAGSMTVANFLRSANMLLGGVFYLQPNKRLVFRDIEKVTTPYYLSDYIDGPYAVGARDFSATSDAGAMINDALVWGTAKGVDFVTFARVQDTGALSSQATHGRWQYGEFTPSIYKQASVDHRADALVNGNTASQKGAKWDRLVVEATIFKPLFQVGDVVACEFFVHDGTLYEPFEAPSGNGVGTGRARAILPVRRMTITFPTNKSAQFSMMLSRELDEPWNINEFFFPKFNFGGFGGFGGFPSLPPPSPGLPPPPTPDPVGCVPAAMDMTPSDVPDPYVPPPGGPGHGDYGLTAGTPIWGKAFGGQWHMGLSSIQGVRCYSIGGVGYVDNQHTNDGAFNDSGNWDAFINLNFAGPPLFYRPLTVKSSYLIPLDGFLQVGHHANGTPSDTSVTGVNRDVLQLHHGTYVPGESPLPGGPPTNAELNYWAPITNTPVYEYPAYDGPIHVDYYYRMDNNGEFCRVVVHEVGYDSGYVDAQGGSPGIYLSGITVDLSMNGPDGTEVSGFAGVHPYHGRAAMLGLEITYTPLGDVANCPIVQPMQGPGGEAAVRINSTTYRVSRPIVPGSSKVWVNGLAQSQGSSLDYVESAVGRGDLIFRVPITDLGAQVWVTYDIQADPVIQPPPPPISDPGSVNPADRRVMPYTPTGAGVAVAAPYGSTQYNAAKTAAGVGGTIRLPFAGSPYNYDIDLDVAGQFVQLETATTRINGVVNFKAANLHFQGGIINNWHVPRPTQTAAGLHFHDTKIVGSGRGGLIEGCHNGMNVHNLEGSGQTEDFIKMFYDQVGDGDWHGLTFENLKFYTPGNNHSTIAGNDGGGLNNLYGLRVWNCELDAGAIMAGDGFGLEIWGTVDAEVGHCTLRGGGFLMSMVRSQRVHFHHLDLYLGGGGAYAAFEEGGSDMVGTLGEYCTIHGTGGGTFIYQDAGAHGGTFRWNQADLLGFFLQGSGAGGGYLITDNCYTNLATFVPGAFDIPNQLARNGPNSGPCA